MTAVFDLRDVGLRRGGLPILEDVTWTVRSGERWVILGPNGAGKTTLVRILSTYVVPSTGTIDVLARRIGRTNVAELRPRIGYLSPSLAHMIPARLTPRQIVDAAQVGAVVPWYADPDGIDHGRTERALAAAGLADASERPLATFSSGEQLRIQLARALVVAPDALLLDEPMASLDIGGRETLISTLAGLAVSDIGAIVVVLHRVEDIPPGFTHALLVSEGRVVMAGPLDEALTDEPMSDCFGTPLKISRSGPRFGATVADDRQSEVDSSSQSIASR